MSRVGVLGWETSRHVTEVSPSAWPQNEAMVAVFGGGSVAPWREHFGEVQLEQGHPRM